MSGRPEAPGAARPWPTGAGFLRPPYQPDVGFSPVRLQASASQRRRSPAWRTRWAHRPALPTRTLHPGWPAAFAVPGCTAEGAHRPDGHCAPARDSPEGHYARPIPKARPHPPRGPLLGRGCVVLAVIAHTTSAASLRPSRRLPAVRLYAGSLPSGRVLAGTQTFPALSHRSVPCCHRPYAGEPCGCTCPIASPQTLAFAHATRARRSRSPQLALSAP